MYREKDNMVTGLGTKLLNVGDSPSLVPLVNLQITKNIGMFMATKNNMSRQPQRNFFQKGTYIYWIFSYSSSLIDIN